MTRSTIVLLTAYLVAVAAASAFQRISGGETTTISTYPYAASLSHNRLGFGVFQIACGGSIISSRAVLTAAYCLYKEQPERWRIRVGSATTTGSGSLHTTEYFVLHPHYNAVTKENDIAILYVKPHFIFTTTLQFANLPDRNYIIPHNTSVWAIGWGAMNYGGSVSGTLRRVQLYIVETRECKSRYYGLSGPLVTDNNVCAVGLDVTGKGQCLGDNGSPLVANNLIIGLYSWSHQCGTVHYPGVNTYIPKYIDWITANY